MNRVTLLLGAVALVLVTVWAFAPGPRDTAAAPGVRVGPRDAYNPVAAGDSLPAGFRQLLPRDAIAPVYDPSFVSADAAGWPAMAQVIGVAGGNEAKAYPVSFLNRREMVIDEIGGEPILVSW
jgi:hypothetical protein